MRRDVVLNKPIASSFLSCEKDTDTILRKLFVESKPYSDDLKRLLVDQSADCLDTKRDVSTYSLARLIQEQYIMLGPKIELPENDQLKSFVVLSFDKFTPTSNPEFRDCMVHFDIVCHHDTWNLGNFRQRPFKILGHIDGILNKSKLSGIGELNFVGCVYELVNEDWSFYSLTYQAVHGSDDRIAPEDEE